MLNKNQEFYHSYGRIKQTSSCSSYSQLLNAKYAWSVVVTNSGCQFDITGKKEPQPRKCLYWLGLWAHFFWFGVGLGCASMLWVIYSPGKRYMGNFLCRTLRRKCGCMCALFKSQKVTSFLLLPQEEMSYCEPGSKPVSSVPPWTLL